MTTLGSTGSAMMAVASRVSCPSLMTSSADCTAAISPATSAYTKAVREGRFSTHRGHVFAGEDVLRGRIIEALMCDFSISRDE